MMIKTTIAGKQIRISEHASLVLAALVELERAGLVENGTGAISVDPGCDAGSLEGQSNPTVTRLGEEFAERMI